MNCKGFSLMELMVSVAIMGIVSVGVLQLMRMQSNIQVNSQVDADFAVLNAQIVSTLASPQHCNANFYGRSTQASFANSIGNTAGGTQGIYQCTDPNTCKPTGATLKIPAWTTDWLPGNTKVSDRVRISSVRYQVNSTTAPSLASLQLEVTMQSRSMKAGSDGKVNPKTFTKIYSVPVVVNGSSILGCPKASNTTVLY